MKLSESSEPVRSVGHILTLFAVFVGAGLIAANAAWTNAPEWFNLLSIGVTAGLTAIGIQIGAQAARGAVYPTPKVEAFVANAQITEPAPAPVVAPVLEPAKVPDAGEVDLDAAVQAAGLT